MNILSRASAWIYYYYQIYLFLIPSLLLSLFLFSLFRKKSKRSFGVVKTCSIFLILFVLCGISSHHYSKMMFRSVKYHVTLLQQDQKFDSIVDRIEISKIVYSPSVLLDKKASNETNREYVLNIPYGYDRKVYFYSSGGRGKVSVSYSFGETQYAKELDLSSPEYTDDGYLLPDNSHAEIIIDLLIRLGMHLITIILSTILVLWLYAHIELPKNIKQFCYQNRYGLVCFFILLIHLYGNKQSSINNWAASSYGLHYGLGFGSRFMIGSILKLLSGDFVSHNEAHLFLLFHLSLLCGVLSYFINFLIKKSNYNKFVIYLCLLYLAHPGGITALWRIGIYGKLETYNLLYTLLSVSVFRRIKNVPIKYIVITALSLFNMAIYQGFVFLYYPIIVLIMTVDCYDNQQDKRRWIFTLSNISFVFASFFVLRFATSTIFSNVQEMTHYLDQNTSLEYLPFPLELEYFLPLSKAFKMVTSNIISPYSYRLSTFITAILLSPVIFIILSLWYYCMRRQTLKSSLSLPYLPAVLSLLLFLPQYIFNIDWGRWSIALNTYAFFATLYLYYTGFPKMQEAFQKAEKYILKYSYLSIALLIYVALLSRFLSIVPLAEVNHLLTPLIQP